MNATYRKQRGFTIVELLVVIVVIGILAAITIVSYNGIQQRARNTVTISSVKQTMTILSSSYALNGSIHLSDLPSGALGVCIGSAASYPASSHLGAGECYKEGSAAYYFTSAALEQQLNQVGKLSFTAKEISYGGNVYGRGLAYDDGEGNGSTEPGYFLYYDLIGPGVSCSLAGGTGDTNISSWYDFGAITSCQINVTKQVGGDPITY